MEIQQADNKGRGRPTITRMPPKVHIMADHKTLERALACCRRLPKREVSAQTAKAYRMTFARMWREPVLDPLRPGIARDTYNYRRAALHYGSRTLLLKLFDGAYAAASRQDQAGARRWLAVLKRVLVRVEPALALDAPLQPGVSSWSAPPSRWHQANGRHRKRAQNSKRNVLQYLPKDWDRRLWAAVREPWPHRDAVAVHLTVPLRPAELVPGDRPRGWSPGVELELRSPRCLAISFLPVKSHRGLFGTEITTITVDPVQADDPAAYLAKRCAAAGGRLVISTSSKNAVRKAFEDLGRQALPGVDVTITPSVLRHQLIADLKATFDAGGQVAAAAGQSSDRTQSRYGRVQHGRRRKGYLAINSLRKPRTGNIDRARRLARKRQNQAACKADPAENPG